VQPRGQAEPRGCHWKPASWILWQKYVTGVVLNGWGLVNVTLVKDVVCFWTTSWGPNTWLTTYACTVKDNTIIDMIENGPDNITEVYPGFPSLTQASQPSRGHQPIGQVSVEH
jgi:hypothetical protein